MSRLEGDYVSPSFAPNVIRIQVVYLVYVAGRSVVDRYRRQLIFAERERLDSVIFEREDRERVQSWPTEELVS